MLPPALATDVSTTTIVVVAAVISAAAAVFASINSSLKDRGEKVEKKTEKAEAQHTADQSEIARQGKVLDHLSISMVGRPADPENGLPRIRGFTDDQTDVNTAVAGELAFLREEITTTNGGGTLKGSIGYLKTEFGKLRDQFEALQETVEKKVDQP